MVVVVGILATLDFGHNRNRNPGSILGLGFLGVQMIPKSAISFRITDSPDDPEKFVGTAEQTTRIHWLVGKTAWTPNDTDNLKLSLTRRVWIVLYGDIRTGLIEVMNTLRNVPDPDYSVTTALSKIEELLGKLNLPHSEDLE